MRVTLVNKYYPPHLGGIEFHIRDLAEALGARPEVEPRILVANEGRPRVDEEVNGVPITRLPRLAAFASTPIAPTMPWALRRNAHETDLLHLHFPYPWGELSWLASGTGVPTVMTYHSDIVRQSGLLELYRPLLHRVLREVDLIIASSPNMVRHSPFLRHYAHKCRVVPFGIDVERFARTANEGANELRRRYGNPLVLFVGRLIYYKGADILVHAMRDVPATLVMIGTGPLEKHLRGIARDLGISDRVTFLAPVGHDELPHWYQAADVFCLPSVERSEAFGLVQLEAHAAGVPVVSTDLTTGVPFVNQDRETGLVVPPGDPVRLARALRRVLEDDALRRQLGRQAQERARGRFTIERMVDETIAVYREAEEIAKPS